MASDINEHISSGERSKWNETKEKLENHLNDPKLHIPSPPSSGNYYLGNDLKWHRVPIASASIG